jgi:putative transposase
VENGLIGPFNGRLRDECLNLYLFWSLKDARDKLETWRDHYDTERSHSARGETEHEIQSCYRSKTKLSQCPEIGTTSPGRNIRQTFIWTEAIKGYEAPQKG